MKSDPPPVAMHNSELLFRQPSRICPATGVLQMVHPFSSPPSSRLVHHLEARSKRQGEQRPGLHPFETPPRERRRLPDAC